MNIQAKTAQEVLKQYFDYKEYKRDTHKNGLYVKVKRGKARMGSRFGGSSWDSIGKNGHFLGTFCYEKDLLPIYLGAEWPHSWSGWRSGKFYDQCIREWHSPISEKQLWKQKH